MPSLALAVNSAFAEELEARRQSQFARSIAALRPSPVRLVAENMLPAEAQTETAVHARLRQATMLATSGQPARALPIYDDVALHIEPSNELTLRWLAGIALLDKGTALGALNRTAEEFATYDFLLAQLTDPIDPFLYDVFATALVRKAEHCFAEGQIEAAGLLSDELINRFGEQNSVADWVARGILIKGRMLVDDERFEEVLALNARLPGWIAEENAVELRQAAALGLLNSSTALVSLGRHDETVALGEQVFHELADADELVLRQIAAEFVFLNIFLLSNLDRAQEALDAAERALGWASAFGEIEFQSPVIRSLSYKASALSRLGHAEEAILTNDQIIQLGQSSDAALSEFVADALIAKAALLRQLGKHEEQLAVLADVLQRFADSSDQALLPQVGQAFLESAFTMSYLDRVDEEIRLYEEVIRRFAEATETSLLTKVAAAMASKALAIASQGRLDQGIIEFQEVVGRFGGAAEKALNWIVAHSLTMRADLLRRVGRYDESIHDNEQVSDLYDGAADALLQYQVSLALLQKAETLNEYERHLEVLPVVSDFISRFEGSDSLDIRRNLGLVLAEKSTALFASGDVENALAAYNEINGYLGEADEPELRGFAARALITRAITLAALGQTAEAIEAFDHAVLAHGVDSEVSVYAEARKALQGKEILHHSEPGIPVRLGVESDNMVRLAEGEQTEGSLPSPTPEELLGEYLKATGIKPSQRQSVATAIRAIVGLAATEMTAPQGQIRSSDQDSSRGAAIIQQARSAKPPLPKLSAKQIAAIKKRAKQRPWSKRPQHRMSAFEWVRDNYGEWIPGLLQSHLKADTQLYQAFTARVSREGLPDWLDVPSEPEARLRSIGDPEERRELLVAREAAKRQKARSRAASPK